MIRRITRIEGRALLLPGNDIDTDRIIPARYLRAVSFDGMEQHVFEDERKTSGYRGTNRPHPFDDPRSFFYAPAEGNHQLDVGQPHDFPGALHRGAFQCKPFGIRRMCVARGTSEAEHRVSLVRLKPAPTEKACVFVRLEVRHADDHRLRVKRGCNRCYAFGKAADEELSGGAIISREVD